MVGHRTEEQSKAIERIKDWVGVGVGMGMGMETAQQTATFDFICDIASVPLYF
jgi:hypothetical protein